MTPQRAARAMMPFYLGAGVAFLVVAVFSGPDTSAWSVPGGVCLICAAWSARSGRDR